MASPVDTTVKYFTSDMPGAPVLTGQAGSLIALLDACLVNGWGIQTASSVVVSGGVATATFPANHAGFPDAVVLVAGATPAGLNGEQKVTARGANTIAWATASPDGAATGTITVKMAAAGFAKPFAGTNLAVYKSASPQAHGQLLRIADTTTKSARVVGYETMSAVSSGTGPFPTSAQISGGYYWHKTDFTDTTPVPWVVVSDGRFIHYLNAPATISYDANFFAMGVFQFGDMIPRISAGDNFATVLSGASSNNIYGAGHILFSDVSETSGTVAMPRNYLAIAGANRGRANRRDLVPYGAALPNQISGQVEFSPVEYFDAGMLNARANFPGVAISRQIGAEIVQKNSWNRVRLSSGRAYLLCASHPYGASTSTGLNFLSYDLTGPWR